MSIEKFAVGPVAWQLNNAFQVIIQAFGALKPQLASLHTSQNLIQAIPPGGSPLLQIPFFTPKVVKAIEGNTPSHLSVHDYMKIPADRRKKMTVGPGLLTDREYQVAMNTAAQFPAIKVEKVFFKVRGEKVITGNSLCQLIVKFRFVPPWAINIPPIDEKDLLQADDDNDKDDTAQTYTPALANGPYFARDHSPVWHVLMCDAKMGRLAVPPYLQSTFNKPVLTADGEPTFNVQTIKMQFGAPPQEGRYTFTVHVINDSYLGFDAKETITMTVENESQAEVIQEEGEISEPDEGEHFKTSLLV
jgi:translocation protein SEC63